jgi:hypothetical protein
MPNRGQRYVSLVERGVIRMPASPGSPAGPDPAAPGARQRPSGRPPPPARRPEQGPEQRPERRAGRHVWVLAVDGARRPGLLTQWRREPAGDGHGEGSWTGLVVYAVEVDGQPALIQVWIPADRLRPA